MNRKMRPGELYVLRAEESQEALRETKPEQIGDATLEKLKGSAATVNRKIAGHQGVN